MPRLYQITVPGLSVSTELAIARARLLADFPSISEVLATTIPATLLIVYRGEDQLDDWLAALSDVRRRAPERAPVRQLGDRRPAERHRATLPRPLRGAGGAINAATVSGPRALRRLLSTARDHPIAFRPDDTPPLAG